MIEDKLWELYELSKGSETVHKDYNGRSFVEKVKPNEAVMLKCLELLGRRRGMWITTAPSDEDSPTVQMPQITIDGVPKKFKIGKDS